MPASKSIWLANRSSESNCMGFGFKSWIAAARGRTNRSGGSAAHPKEGWLVRGIVVEESHDARGGELRIAEMIGLDMGVDTALQQGLLAFIDHQREQIQAATEVESKYLRFLSHDLRNNLNQVILVLDLLKGRLAGIPEFEEDLGDVMSAHSTILNTIAGMDALLQAERLRKGAIQPKTETVRLPAVVTALVRHLSGQARPKGLSLVADVSCDVTLSSDRELIA